MIAKKISAKRKEATEKESILNPGECRERIADLGAAGVEHLLLSPIVEGDLEAQLERLAALQES